MSERCIVRVKFTPAAAVAEVRRAVGGFLRYVQHRDLHPEAESERADREVAGLLKYVAYRDQASARAELFGPDGMVGTQGRKALAEFVARSLESSKPQLYRARSGSLMDRRRAVSRFVISPEHATGLDLERLTRAAVRGLEAEAGVSGVRWIAAIHRNTRHRHVHLVVAGMHQTETGIVRLDITKRRLAAIKEAVGLEIERQRVRTYTLPVRGRSGETAGGGITRALPALKSPSPALIRTPPAAPPPIHRRTFAATTPDAHEMIGSIIQLRAVARRYQRQMQRAAEEEARRLQWERAA